MVICVSDYDKLYDRVFRMLGTLTPLRGHDCGTLCGVSCCSGGDGDGMLLFPGEKTELPVKEAELGRLAVCSGSCERDKRPLSCRIFPFFPTVGEKGRVSVRIDSRAMGICPLAQYSENVIFDRRFVRRLGRAGRLLARDEECRSFMREVTLDIEALERLYK